MMIITAAVKLAPIFSFVDIMENIVIRLIVVLDLTELRKEKVIFDGQFLDISHCACVSTKKSGRMSRK